MKSLLFALLLFATPNMTLATAPTTTTPTVADHKRLPTATGVWTTIKNSWQWCVNLFLGVFSKLGMRKMPSILKEMYATRVEREKKHTQQYIKIGIPQKVATIAGTLDRMEEDFTSCRTALKSADDDEIEASLYKEIKRIDDGVDTYMEKVGPIIDEYETLAFKKRDTQLIKFMQILQSRSFLEQLLDSPAK